MIDLGAAIGLLLDGSRSLSSLAAELRWSDHLTAYRMCASLDERAKKAEARVIELDRARIEEREACAEICEARAEEHAQARVEAEGDCSRARLEQLEELQEEAEACALAIRARAAPLAQPGTE